MPVACGSSHRTLNYIEVPIIPISGGAGASVAHFVHARPEQEFSIASADQGPLG